MAVRYFTLALGIIFLLVGVLGFVPAFTTPAGAYPDLVVEGPGHGYLFGLFHVNVLHNIVHLLFGLWGIAAYMSFPASRVFCRTVAIIYAILTIMGLIPVLNTTFGLIPLHGNDVWLHAILAVSAAYFGWARLPATRPARGTATDTGRYGY